MDTTLEVDTFPQRISFIDAGCCVAKTQTDADECGCVLPEQSCPACRAAARRVALQAYGEEIPY